MSQERTHDLRSNVLPQVSIPPGTNYPDSADVSGSWVPVKAMQGPIQALCQCAAATGSPSAFAVNFEMDEADDSSGNGVQKVSNQTEVTLTADNTAAFLRAIVTKPYVRVRVESSDSSFTDGSSPAVDVGATVVGQKRSY